jgi:REP element-mobilizing transposase RayT
VCYYHVVWATKGRAPSLAPPEFDAVEAVVRSASTELRVVIHAVGCLPDHVHVVASIPPALAVAETVGRWKGSSSHLLNERRSGAGHPETFAWQAENGVHTFGRSALPRVVAYVENQHEHHRLNEIWPGLERTATDPPPRPVLSPGGASVA